MNFIFSLPPSQKMILSNAGLNVFRLMQKNGKRPPYLNEILYTLLHIRDAIAKNDFEVIYDICDTKFFKKTTLFKGVYCYKTNHIPERIITILECQEKRNVVLHRIDIMINTLTAATTTDNTSS
jgi:hypothetical protein